MADELQVKCPAAEVQHPILSPNEDDVECRIQGNLRPGEQAKRHCCRDYATCPAWIGHRKVQMMNREVRVAGEMRRRAPHTLQGAERQRVRA